MKDTKYNEIMYVQPVNKLPLPTWTKAARKSLGKLVMIISVLLQGVIVSMYAFTNSSNMTTILGGQMIMNKTWHNLQNLLPLIPQKST